MSSRRVLEAHCTHQLRQRLSCDVPRSQTLEPRIQSRFQRHHAFVSKFLQIDQSFHEQDSTLDSLPIQRLSRTLETCARTEPSMICASINIGSLPLLHGVACHTWLKRIYAEQPMINPQSCTCFSSLPTPLRPTQIRVHVLLSPNVRLVLSSHCSHLKCSEMHSLHLSCSLQHKFSGRHQRAVYMHSSQSGHVSSTVHVSVEPLHQGSHFLHLILPARANYWLLSDSICGRCVRHGHLILRCCRCTQSKDPAVSRSTDHKRRSSWD